MITLQDGIKYLGLTAIVYFLIKAFADDKLDNKQIAILVIAIMVVAIFIMNQQVDCPKRPLKERYQVTDPPLVDSIYPGPNNTDTPMDTIARAGPTKPAIKWVDKDIQDMKSIMGIDKKVYHELVENEKKAKEVIRKGPRFHNEMVYTNTNPFNTVPLGTQLYGYTYLPPENWFRAYERPPVCVTDQRCAVCPLADKGTADLMEFDTTNNVVGPDGINLRYAKKVLNQDQGWGWNG
jgi:hypothetical protein